MSRIEKKRKEKWDKYLTPPEEYRFPKKVTFIKSYLFPKYKVELFLQANGPGRVQKVMKAVPHSISKPVPGVVVPFYFPEAMLGFEPETGEKLPKFSGITMLADLAERGVVAISAEAYHLSSFDSALSRNDFSRWRKAGETLLKKYPTWCGMGKLMLDTRLLADLLEEDPLVDPERIGIAGHSLGGKMAFYTGCFDPRIKVILASDFGMKWEQSNWDDIWYWGERLQELIDTGMTHRDLLETAGGKPYCLLAGQYDDEKSMEMIPEELYRGTPEKLLFLHHASGHRPPKETLEKGYDFLLKNLMA